jgi:hypothetical protein
MDKVDITNQVMEMYDAEIINNIFIQAKNELNNNIPEKHVKELRGIIQHSSLNELTAISLIPLKVNNDLKIIIKSIASIELLAAAGSLLGSWYSQPINFGGAGFTLDVRRIINTNNEVDLYIMPNEMHEGKIKNSLGVYAGKNIEIVVTNNGNIILEACLYVSELANLAEGSGKVINLDESTCVNGKLSINVIIIPS